MTGYILLTGCGMVLAVICFIRSRSVSAYDADSMIYSGGSAGCGTLTCSVFAAWMWTTSIFGATETYALYGVWGPVSYVAGACLAFGGMILFLVYLRRRFPQAISWLNFVQARYGRRTRRFYNLFAVIVPAYVLIEQGVGIAYLMEHFYGSSFRIISFFSVIIAAGFVFLGGMKSLLSEERLVTAVILAAFAVLALWFLGKGQPLGEIEASGVPRAGGLVSVTAISALRYFIMAVVIAFSQIVFDPGYYVKAKLARSTRQMAGAFIAGGILLWGSVALAASLYLGSACAATGAEVTDLFRGPARLILSVAIIFIGISTIAHYMMGLFAVFSLDLQEEITGDRRTDRERIVFGRILLAAVGVFCACMTIALENISLLSIDVFCAIFFAAPCVPLVIGTFSRRNFGRLPVIAASAGIIGGLILWVTVPGGPMQTQFLGMTASLVIPALIMLGGFIRRLPYDR